MALGLVLAGVGIATSLFGGKKSADAAKDAGRAEARVHNFNASMNELDAKFIERQSVEGQHLMTEQRIKGLSTIRAKQGKSGVTGVTPFEVEVEAARIYKNNEDRYREEMRVRAYKSRKNAELNRMKADAALEGGKFGAQAAWASGVSNAASFGATYFQNQELFN